MFITSEENNKHRKVVNKMNKSGYKGVTSYNGKFKTTINVNGNDLLKEQTTLTVYDLSGKIIYTTLFNPNGTKVIFNIPHISKGLYFVSLNNSQVKGMQKWIVE